MFIGEYQHNRDKKGRLVIPSKFRDELTETFVLTRGLDQNLSIYSLQQWSLSLKRVRKLASTKLHNRMYQHVLFAKASECSCDSMGRIIIPDTLAKLISLGKECTLIGMDDHIEIWNRDVWENYFLQADNQFSEIAEGLAEVNDES